MIEKDRDDKIRERHPGEDQPGECAKGPEGHLELAIGFLGILHREIEAEDGKQNTDRAESSKNDENTIVRQMKLLPGLGGRLSQRVGQTHGKLQLRLYNLADEEYGS
jgi:hypothetical protein